ncbi:hypothetical protein SAMN06264364_1035 [Quadrisphaera granulorum]|uniref:Zinc-binding dehydrogenase n=1 Tax=Quadrisphaera granulorum TaxID=317664 RepID=A0A316AYN4_9ACTN|nr:hypothetical protein [Quadrisphaera granulorum]PWJ55337.1 hypothetical protein BXY45_1035 [Quadrisphaera granulorum]SZE95401.1 hypothetical protein SAMN06264364_1035 [Quadrisphaera granulorum]
MAGVPDLAGLALAAVGGAPVAPLAGLAAGQHVQALPEDRAGYAGDHPATIRLAQEGKVDLAPFITHRIGLDELVDVGYDTLLHRTETAVKILVSPTA